MNKSSQRMQTWITTLAQRFEVVRGIVKKGREISCLSELDRGLVVVWDWSDKDPAKAMRPKGIVVTRVTHPFMAPVVAVQVFDGGGTYIFDPAVPFSRGTKMWAAA